MPSEIKLDSKRLLASKWTAVEPRNREKHFVVRHLSKCSAGGRKEDYVELEAILSGRMHRLPLHELSDPTRWTRGWRRGP